MSDDADTSDDDDFFGDGDNVGSPAGIFGFLPKQTSDSLNDEEELLPDAAQYNNSTYMAPSDAITANQLLTSHESISAYKLQKSVKIAENAPILFADIKNNNEPIIDYNKLLSTVDIDLPQSIILYLSNADHAKLYQKSTADHNDDDDDDFLSESLWQKEFEKKAQLTKQRVLQNNNETYKNLKFEFDKYHKLELNDITKAEMDKLVNNNCEESIKIKQNNGFQNVAQQLKNTNPALFMTDNMAKNGLNNAQNARLRHLLMTQNLLRLTGYNDNDECELLAVDPQNIKTNDIELDVSHLLERIQCDFDDEIIIDDNPDIDNSESSEKDTDIEMPAIVEANHCPKADCIELEAVKPKLNNDSFLRAKYQTRQKMDAFQPKGSVCGKRKHRDRDCESLLLQSVKRRRVQHNSIRFNIKTDLSRYEQLVLHQNDSDKNGNSKEEDDDLELLLPADVENDVAMDGEDGYDEDAIGDDLFDMMPDFEEEWNGNNEKAFGIVEDVVAEPQQSEVEAKMDDDTQQKQQKQALPLLKCAQNNSSIWPNRNGEYESCEWLDSVIISDKIAPKKEMNTNLIIDLNDHRMEWTEDFIKNLNKYKNERSEDTKEKSQSVESLFSAKRWNLSNDDQYTFTDISVAQKRNLHTPMAYNLDKEIFPQIANIDEWVGLHRKPIKLDEESTNSKHIKIILSGKNKVKNQRMEDIRHKYSMYIPKNWSELSAVQDRIILLEYLEEYPLIIQSTGMTSNITTLYRKSAQEYEQNLRAPDIMVDDGTVKFLNPKEKSPLLGAPRQTKWVTILENKLYVAPIRSHSKTLNINNDDKLRGNNLFLLVGNNHTYFIRKVDAVFAVGQIQPRQVVYHPGSRKFRSYMHDRCKVHIYRLLQSKKTVSVSDICKDFPLETDDAIKETLRTVAEHDKTIGGGYWHRKSDFLSNSSALEIQEMVSPEQEVLRQIFMNCYCRLYNGGISPHLIGGTRGGGWKRVLKNLVFNKDLLDNMYEMKKELERDIIAYDKEKSAVDNIMDTLLLKEKNSKALTLTALLLIEELLFCTSWYISDQFLRCYRGEGEMQLNGYGNPFKNGEGFNYLRDKDKTSSEAIKLMVASAGNRANTKSDFRRMPMQKAIEILKKRYLVPDAVVEKLDRRKIMELLQKKSRDALSAGSQNKTALRYARLTGSRKTFARQQYAKKMKRLMKQHLLMLRGNIRQHDNDDANNENPNDMVADLEDLMEADNESDNDSHSMSPSRSVSAGATAPRQRKKKKKLVKRYKLRYTYCYNEQITGERKKEQIEFPEAEYPEMMKKYRLCIRENDKKFTRLLEYSKLHQMKCDEMEGDGDEIPAFMNDRQRERYQKMQKIRHMAPEDREKILLRLEKEKDYITCSSCKRKGHNSNNKYCPKYHENKEKRLKLNKNNENSSNREEASGIDSFIERAIDKKHKSYRSAFMQGKGHKKGKKKKYKIGDNNDGINDPRLNLVAVLKHIMEKAKNVNGSVTFKLDPTRLDGYISRVSEPMCLDWIQQNIQYTEECIKAPYKAALSQNNLMDLPKIDIVRGAGKPDKKEYKTFEAFKADIKLLHSNSAKFNGVSSNFTHLASTIVEQVTSMQRQYKVVIESLDAEVNATYMTFDLQPILNKLINGILDAPTLDAFKSSFNSLSALQLNQENVPLALYEIRQKVHDKHYQTFADFVYDLKELQQFCYDLNKAEFETGLKILPTQFDNKLKPFKQSLSKIDPDSVNHFKLNKKPPFI